MLKGILNERAFHHRGHREDGAGENARKHSQKWLCHGDQRLAVAGTATPSSFNLARGRRSSSVPGKRLTTSRGSRTPEVFWPSSIRAMPFFKCAGGGLKVL